MIRWLGFVMNATEYLGIFAAVCSTSASMPQLCSTTPQTLSVGSLLLRCTGGITWATYGALKKDYPLAIASSIVACVEIILWAKRHRALYRLKSDGIATPPIDPVVSASPATSASKRAEVRRS